jgi:superfamily II DNA or RNA helicase
VIDFIKILKINEVYVKIFCEPSISAELSEYFSFFVPGYNFTPAFRNKTWNGKIYLYNKQTSLIYYGLISYIELFAKERKYNLVYDDKVLQTTSFSLQEAKEYAKSLQVQSRNKDIDARDYQIEAFAYCIRNRRQMLVSPTASGKSLIAYFITRYMTDQNKKGIIIVPTTSLVEQLYSDFQDYSTKNGWNVEDNIHRIYSGHEKTSNKIVTISTWQSIYTLPKQYFDYQWVIGDEAHNFKAKSLSTIMTQLNNAEVRIGMTGTLDGTKTHKLVLEGLFGPAKKIVTTKELIDKKQLSDFEIKCLVLKHPENLCKMVKDYKYIDEIKYLVNSEARNKFIRNLALSLNGNTLVLFQYVKEHGKVLYEMINDKNENRKVFFVHGGTETEDRENIRSIVESEKDAIIVASYGTFSTGVNIRNLHNIIFASPTKSRIRNLQSIGRGLRLGNNKEKAILFDISDDLRYTKKRNFTLLHFIERVKIYNEEKFAYRIYNIDLKV